MLRSIWLQGIVLLLCLTASFAASRLFHARSVDHAQAAFLNLADENQKALVARLTSYLNAIEGAASYLRVSDSVRASDWADYVAGLTIDTTYPGVSGLGLIVPVARQDRSAFLQDAENDGVENLTIHPETDLPEGFVIKFIAPLLPNDAALGLDIAFEAERRQAAVLARDTNSAQITAPITLVQGGSESAGFLLLVPLFGRSDTQLNAGTFQGWVYAPIVGSQIFEQLTLAQDQFFEVEIADGGDGGPQRPIYQSTGGRDRGDLADFSATADIQLFGRTWHMKWRSTKAYEDTVLDGTRYVVLFWGLAMTALLAGLLYSLSIRRRAIERIVSHKTDQLKTSEKQLRELESRRDMALTGARIGVFDVDLTTGQSVVSDTWKDLMGVSEEDSETNPQALFHERIHPDDKAIVELADSDCISGLTERSVSEFRIRYGNSGSDWRWMRADAVVADRDDTGKAIRLLGAQTDITALRRTQAWLEASEKQLSTILANAPVGMALCEEQGEFFNVNQALCHITGFSEEELLGSKFKRIISAGDFKDLLAKLAHVRGDERGHYQGELRIKNRGGEMIWCLISISHYIDTHSGDLTYIVQLQDISDVKAVEKLKSEFVSTVSHELRTPLTSINGSLGLILGTMKSNLPDKAVRLLSIAKSNCDRLTQLVNDILDMEKIAAGSFDFHYETVDVTQLVQACAQQVAPIGTANNVTIELRDAGTPRYATIDSNRFQQVVINLLSNAVKFSYQGRKVEIDVRPFDGALRIAVRNHGKGIPETFAQKIFQPFSQADSSDTRGAGGTGLGLHISKQIVENMGGEIGFSTPEPSITEFWFTVRAAQDAQVQPDPDVDEMAAQSDFLPSVLHIEDDQDFAEVMNASFADLADITTALTLAEGRKQLTTHKFDLVIIDWELPDGHGRDVLDLVEGHQGNIPVIALSAYEATAPDPRISYSLTKSRTDIAGVVQNALDTIVRARQKAL
ncbi:MAG: CHASE domain-containing protein [Sulfitobacter sp.]